MRFAASTRVRVATLSVQLKLPVGALSTMPVGAKAPIFCFKSQGCHAQFGTAHWRKRYCNKKRECTPCAQKRPYVAAAPSFCARKNLHTKALARWSDSKISAWHRTSRCRSLSSTDRTRRWMSTMNDRGIARSPTPTTTRSKHTTIDRCCFLHFSGVFWCLES